MAINCWFGVACVVVEQKGARQRTRRPGNILRQGIKEEVTALGSKKAGRGFRQEIVFFVDGLPPTSTDPAGCWPRRRGCFSHCSPTASNVEEGDSSRKGKVVAMAGI